MTCRCNTQSQDPDCHIDHTLSTLEADIAFPQRRTRNMEHTPANWIVTELDPAPTPGFAYAIGHDPLSESDVPWPVALAVTPADAHLIAAAPALLSALESLETVARSYLRYPLEGEEPGYSAKDLLAYCIEARAAILAAKGDK